MKSRHKKYKFLLIFPFLAGLGFLLFLLTRGYNWVLLNPKGTIAHQERDLIIVAVSLMLAVAITMFVAAGYIAWKYRAGNRAKYAPNWDYSHTTQVTIWAGLIFVVSVLAVLNWQSTHALDPYKPLVSAAMPVTIQVVALQWKWLFIYPDQNIATVNFVEFPSGTPVNFQLTADAPMNSFWIPQLGGQMYAMPGMSTQLHLEADAPGEFNGSAAEISGAGFAGMKFVAKASTQTDFNDWVAGVKQNSPILSMTEYDKLAQPSENNPVKFYSDVTAYLYNHVMMKYMAPEGAQ